MATVSQFETAFTRIDTATSAAASVLTQIRAKIAELETNAGISASDEASVLAKLDGVATSLENMAKTPENPVPVEPGPGGGTTEPGGGGTTPPTEPTTPTV